MPTEKLTVEIEGISPLLMHAFPMVSVDGIDKMIPEDQAKHAEYRSPDGTLYVPGINLQRALVAAATFSKGKGRATLQKPVAACVFVSPERLILNPQSYVVDSRPVVVPSTRGRILRHRPRFDVWTLSFCLEYDETMISAKQMRQVVDDAGKLVGLLDFRPMCKGPFGRFMVTSWKKQ